MPLAAFSSQQATSALGHAAACITRAQSALDQLEAAQNSDPKLRHDLRGVLGTLMAAIQLLDGADCDSELDAMRRGATDCLVKPVSEAQLARILDRVMKLARHELDHAKLQAQLQQTGRFGSLIGRSGAMELVYENIARAAPTSAAVFLSGETGTGKELAARTLHDLSRRAGPFVTLNGAGSLVEGDLSRERMAGGTLFLDEVCEMPNPVQAHLLRMLETDSGVRVVSATRHDPARAMATGLLRDDLFYRLAVFRIEMPPLRARMEDLPLLTGFLLREIGLREGIFKHATPAAIEQLEHYYWPGNVRELQNVLHHSYVMTPGREIKHPWLPRDPQPAVPVARRGENFSVATGTTLAQVERAVILATLERCGQNRERTAAALGISLKTLYNRLKQYGH